MGNLVVLLSMGDSKRHARMRGTVKSLNMFVLAGCFPQLPLYVSFIITYN